MTDRVRCYLFIAALLSYIQVLCGADFYVSQQGGAVRPFNHWSTAATNVQDAIDAASAGDSVWVTNGVYSAGGRMTSGALTNRVAVTQPVILRSVNGAEVTVIEGYQVPGTANGNGAVRCVYLTNGAVLAGFTLRGGATRDDGGSGNPAVLCGGGVYSESTSAMVSNCLIIGNSARVSGGGAYSGNATLTNCPVYYNEAITGANFTNCVMGYCCTLALPQAARLIRICFIPGKTRLVVGPEYRPGVITGGLSAGIRAAYKCCGGLLLGVLPPPEKLARSLLLACY